MLRIQSTLRPGCEWGQLAILRFCLTPRGAKNKIGAPWPGSRELKSRMVFITSPRAAITVKRSSTREITPLFPEDSSTLKISHGCNCVEDYQKILLLLEIRKARLPFFLYAYCLIAQMVSLRAQANSLGYCVQSSIRRSGTR